MSLFDKLKDTELKSLKFGKDKPGGGTSLEPVMRKPILDTNLVGQERSFNDIAKENRDRISVILKSTPRGRNFVRNQAGLQLSNAHLETSNAPILNTINVPNSKIADIINKGINFLNTANTKYNSSTLGKATRVTPLHFYSPEVTLSQLESVEGNHLDRFGLTPFIEDRYKYINIANANNTTENNRLVKLKTKLNVGNDSDPNVLVDQLKSKVKGILSGVSSVTNLITSVSNLFGGSPFLNNVNKKVNNITKVASPYLDPQIDQYTGGPDSRFGIGATNIRRFDYTNNLDKFQSLNEISSIKAKSARISNSVQLFGVSQAYLDTPDVETFENELPTSSVAMKFQNLNIQRNKKHMSYGGNTIKMNGNTTTYYYKYDTSDPANIVLDKSDEVGFKYFGRTTQTLNYYEREDGDNMSVLFQLINPFTGANLHRIIFPAYINGFKINSDATWNNVSYIGRAEDFYVFSKYKRTASFNLQIPCFNVVELRERHRALGALESSLAGMYGPEIYNKETGKITHGTKLGGILTKLFVGNYLKGEIGIINSLSYDIPAESSWDLDEKLAHNINVSISFTIIHNDLPTYNRKGGFLGKNIGDAAEGFISSEYAVSDTGVSMTGYYDKDGKRLLDKNGEKTGFTNVKRESNYIVGAYNPEPSKELKSALFSAFGTNTPKFPDVKNLKSMAVSTLQTNLKAPTLPFAQSSLESIAQKQLSTVQNQLSNLIKF